MNQVFEFFKKLFDAGDWPARWNCGEWSEFHGWLYIGSDIAIWLAYFIIPIIIIWFIQRKPGMPFLPVFWLFGAFILFCGATHLLDAIIFWWPGYRLSAFIRLLTAIVSFLTVFALIRDLPKALDLKPAGDTASDKGQLEEQLAIRDAEIKALQTELEQLKGK